MTLMKWESLFFRLWLDVYQKVLALVKSQKDFFKYTNNCVFALVFSPIFYVEWMVIVHNNMEPLFNIKTTWSRKISSMFSYL
jgi:hypothetical protein